MITMLIIAAVGASGCAALRWYLCREGRREEDLWGGRVRLTALWNRGGAFGLPVERRALAALSGAALASLAPLGRRSPAAAGLALGGGLANLWERVRHGRVFDYLRFPRAPGPLKRYVYNLADLLLFLGAAGLLLGCLRRGRGKH